MRLNPKNERVKRQYYIYLREARHLAEETLDGVAHALRLFEIHTKEKDFQQFHIQQAIGFKAALANQPSRRTNDKLSASSRHTILLALRNFFKWLAGQPGFKSRMSYADAEYFALSAKETRVAKAVREPPVPTIEQIRHVIRCMPAVTEIDYRNRALIAFTLLTGARVSAIASLRLKHVDLTEGRVVQDAREVHTKFSKTFTTYFFPVGEDFLAIFSEWVRHLRTDKLWGNNDALFPATQVALGHNGQFEVQGLARTGWDSAGPIRAIFQIAFCRAGLAYCHPHSFRRTLVHLGQQICRTPEEFKSWSQNLGHEQVLTTFLSYGKVSVSRQAEIIRALGRRPEPSEAPRNADREPGGAADDKAGKP